MFALLFQPGFEPRTSVSGYLCSEKDSSLFALVEVVFWIWEISVHYLDRAIVIVLKTKRTYFVTPSVNSTCFLQFGQNMLSKSELLSLSGRCTMWHLYTTTQSHIFYRFLFGGTYYGQCVTNQMFFSLICKPNIIKNWFEKSKNAILYSDFGQVQDHSYKAE